MLGHKLIEHLSPDYQVFGTFRSSRSFPERHRGFTRIDGITAQDFDGLVRIFGQVRPDVVVNCIGLIKQLHPERRELVEINSYFPHRLLELCTASRARLIHLSTDCIFSGERGNYSEDCRPDPVDDYGRSKLLGEVESGGLTLRTSIVGPELETAQGLFGWFYSQRGKTVKGFRRAIYSGLTTREASRVIAMVIAHHHGLEGVWQVSSQPISKFDLLTKLNETAGLGITLVPDDDFYCDRSLDGSRFASTTGYQSPDWDQMLEQMINDGGTPCGT